MSKPAPSIIRFRPRPWATALHLLLFGAAFALFMGRKPGMFRAQAILDRVPGFYSHVSNFSLSWLLLAGAGFLWLTMGMQMRHMALAALALVVANVACEFLLPWLNTRDPVDALYGAAGSLLALAWMGIIHRFGLDPICRGEGGIEAV
ncbi:MAG: hypothetical protein WA961_09960 [Rhodanobacter sp.]|jgi:hypothetical protein